MRFEYDITTFPVDPGGYNLTAYTEGVLRLLVGASVFLDASGILLVEFAVVLRKWLRACASGPIDFYYASMDFEEEPILAFRYDTSGGQFRLESVWSETDVGPVSRAEVIAAAQQYLAQLRDDLKRGHDVDLDKTLEEALMDGCGTGTGTGAVLHDV
ncbi:MAG: hypothetical protein HYV07_08420 [Deltaproteobacteria bacterium]|nr:hypothetical protein [Deltaproteobacteria bacterium]